ncbi:phosphoribosyltransferase family protein [Streptomyces sp. NBC_00169]|uniref:phosphoribosyltransferase family protein n=1 Tax=Streptomyces sp. NBC_00169 TaxID=2903630 RepID=UPI00324FE44B
MRGWWRDLTDLVLPAECGGCGRPRTVLCPECRAALTGAVPSRVRPMPEPSGLPATYATAPYADEVRAMLLAHKERGALALAGPLGAALAGAVRVGVWEGGGVGWGRAQQLRQPVAGQAHGAEAPQAGTGNSQAQVGPHPDHARIQTEQAHEEHRQPQAERHRDIRHPDIHPPHPRSPSQPPILLVPVPSARAAVRARGHDPARRIALAAAGELRRTGTPARVVAVLRQGRWVADQSGLNSRQRLENLAGALEVVAGGAGLLAGGRVVLVDDLMTTGATLREAARAVREAIVCRGEVGATDAVYARASREGREEHSERSMENGRNMALSAPGFVGVNGPDDLICAAVIAASPDSFEINRN